MRFVARTRAAVAVTPAIEEGAKGVQLLKRRERKGLAQRWLERPKGSRRYAVAWAKLFRFCNDLTLFGERSCIDGNVRNCLVTGEVDHEIADR